jgi:hypothetical protein
VIATGTSIATAISVHRPVRLILCVAEQIGLLVGAAQSHDRHRHDIGTDMHKRAGCEGVKIVEIASDPAAAAAAQPGRDDDFGFQKTSTVTLP